MVFLGLLGRGTIIKHEQSYCQWNGTDTDHDNDDDDYNCNLAEL